MRSLPFAFCRSLVLTAVLVASGATALAERKSPPPGVQPGLGEAAPPSSMPGDFADGTAKQPKKTHVRSANHGNASGGGIQALVLNPDPGGTGTITYSQFADNPNTHVALGTLAQNLGNDPVRIYEWVRNNVRTEFYHGGNRGAYLTFIERAGNDVDQCSLLGALLKAAGYTPTYYYDYVAVWRSTSGANRVGVYEWLGVQDDESVLAILSDMFPQLNPAGYFTFATMWVTVNIPQRGVVTFVPSIKPHSVGRRPNLDSLSGYTLANARSAAGAFTGGANSPAISSSGLRSYLSSLSVQASNAIRTSTTLHDLDGAELAWRPVVVPEAVSVTAPTSTGYPSALGYQDPSLTQPLSGIPVSFLSRLKLRVGNFTQWFECPQLLGKPLAVEFDGNGAAIVRVDGGEIGRDSTGNSNGSVALEMTFELPLAYHAGQSYTYGYTSTVPRRNAVACVYTFGSSVGRLQKLQQDIAAKEAVSSSSVTAIDRLQIIGQQYLSQSHELVTLALSSLNYEHIRTFNAGFVGSANNPGLDMGVNVVGALAKRSNSAVASESVNSVRSMLLGAVEGTALEQMTGQRAFGAPTVIDYANRSAYLLDSSNFNSIKNSLANYNDTTLGSGATSAIQVAINAGRKIFILSDSNVTYSPTSTSIAGYYDIYADGGFASMLKGASGGLASTATVGNASVLQPVATDPKTATVTADASPVSTTHDPVDLTTGAFLKNDTDLVTGGAEPNGLRLDRSYNSAQRFSDPVGLGRGWTHNYGLQLTMNSPRTLDSRRVGIDEVLPVLIAARLIQDAVLSESSARTWLLGSVAGTWASDQQINTRASISLGARSMEFVKRPDGSYTPPTSIAATLTKQSDGSHDLAFRNSNTIHFQTSDGKFTSIKDPFNNTLTASYISGRLNTVTDSYGRIFTFSYDGTGRLYQVADSTGRNVQYGLEGTTFTFTDAESKTQRYEMNDPDQATYPERKNLLTRIVDARGRTVVENDYDFFKLVYQQRTFGDTTRTSLIKISPGVGTEVDPLGLAARTYFDARGRKIFSVSQEGHMTTWQYDGVDRLVKVITPKGFTLTFAYDANHVMVSERNPNSDTRAVTPDAQGRPVQVANFEGKVTTIEYWDTVSDRVKTVTAPGNIVSSFTYDSRGRVSTQHPAAYAAGQNDTYAYDASGNLDKITHPDAAFDDYTFNARGDLLDMTDRNGAKTSCAYNSRRQMTAVTQWEGSTARTTTTAYDDAGEVDYVTDASGRKTDSEHDALGRLTAVKRGALDAQGMPTITVLTNGYDTRNLLSSATDALGNVTTYGYTPTQHVTAVTDPLNRTTAMSYDQDQRPSATTTPLGYINTVTLDSRGFKDAVTDAESQVVDYGYDKDGRMTTLANRLNKSFGWSYNDTTRTVTSTTPTGKTTTAVSDTRGLPATVTKASGQTTTFNTYDNEGRLLTKTDGVGTTTYAYWPNGLLKNVTENGHTTYRAYDALNRLIRYDDGESHTTTYTYYPSGELKTIVYPDGSSTVTYDYDDFGRLFHVTDWRGRVTTYNYDNASRLTQISRPNGTYRTQSYDAASQLKFMREFKSDGTLLTYEELRYDNDGRITYQFLHPLPAAVTLAQDDLSYDDDNRLSTWNAQTVAFDADGNMTNGPQPSGTFGAYGYDSRNRLTSVSGSTNRYSPDGLRVEITGTGAATFVIDPNAALSRTLARTKGGSTTYYIYGLGLLYEYNGGAGGSSRYYHPDHLGNMVMMTDISQTVTDRWSYTPFGAVTHLSGSTDTPFQFNGELGVQTDANGLLHMRARYYNPRMMRFVNADPIRFSGGVNWYAFGGNSPVSTTDPLGLCDQKIDPMSTLSRAGLSIDYRFTAAVLALPGELAQDFLEWGFGPGARDALTPLTAELSIFSSLNTMATTSQESRAAQIIINKAAGDAWENKVIADVLPETQTNIQRQITITSNGPSGLNVRLDAVGTDKLTGAIRLTDPKASATAPLTKNQVIVYPELEVHGGTVAGQGKPPFTGGTSVPPTKVDIIRKP